ncbi:hypothetical protein AALC25_06460, partial [Lachnospiraceae bacterium 29-84]
MISFNFFSSVMCSSLLYTSVQILNRVSVIQKQRSASMLAPSISLLLSLSFSAMHASDPPASQAFRRFAAPVCGYMGILPISKNPKTALCKQACSFYLSPLVSLFFRHAR